MQIVRFLTLNNYTGHLFDGRCWLCPPATPSARLLAYQWSAPEVPGDFQSLPLLDEEFQKGSMKERSVFDDFRVRMSPAFGPLPSIFGLNSAAYIPCELAGTPYLGPPFYQEQEKNYINALTSIPCIANPRLRLIRSNEDDIALISEDIQRSFSACTTRRPDKTYLGLMGPSSSTLS
ncbi:hypothetical protein BYT27DRAFT_7248422 [Phlegmacium glaucopus]|nr:hypothetical protein BYT27DRAFT_7248422 [Phlegmacium glaucopus]